MIAVCIVLLVALASTSAMEVSTSLGVIRGVILKSRLGEDFYAFRGIRYAKPPEGELRFKNPVPVDPWKPEVFDATKDGPKCPQMSSDTSDSSEDCLRLNVYSKDLNASKPVVIYIHPGGFYSMSAQSKTFSGPELLMDRDIVLVAINYRLGTLGFLATGTADAPGNAGLKDQVIAMKWVQEHIRNFGGDPASVTLMGYSAGSFSVGLHMVSPMSKGLFHRGIAMSSSPVAQWKYTEDQLSLAKKQAELLKCPTDNIKSMVDCLKEKTADDFVKSIPSMFEFGWSPILNWLPVIEKDFGQERFITEDPIVSFQAGRFQRTPLIVGMTHDEFVRIAYYVLKNDTMTKQLNENWETVAPICFQYERNTPKSKEASTVLRKEYLGDQTLSSTGPFEPLGKLYSDGIIGFGVHRFAHLAARYIPVHYYRFSYKGRYSYFNLPPDNKPYGATHHDDLIYLLRIPRLTPLFLKTDPEDTTIERMTRMWTHFAKTGNPNNSDDEYLKKLNWEPLDLKKENFLDIGDELIMKEGLFLERFAIWNKLFPLDWTGQHVKSDSESLDYPEPEE